MTGLVICPVITGFTGSGICIRILFTAIDFELRFEDETHQNATLYKLCVTMLHCLGLVHRNLHLVKKFDIPFLREIQWSNLWLNFTDFYGDE